MKIDNDKVPSMPSHNWAPQERTKQKQTAAFLNVLLTKWPWFLLSIIIAAFAFVALKCIMPTPSTEYYTKITAKYQAGEGKTQILLPGDYPRPIWQNISLPDNSELYKILNSTSIVEEAGRALNYEVSYYQKRILGKRDVWTERPFDVYFLSASHDDSFSVTACPAKDGVAFRDIRGIELPDSVAVHGKDFFVPYDKETESPLGLIKIVPVRHDSIKTIAKQKPQTPLKELLIVKSSDFDARVALDANIKLNNENDLIVLTVETPFSSAFAHSFLAQVVQIADERIRTRLADEYHQANANIDSCLAQLSATGGSLSDGERARVGSTGLSTTNLDRQTVRRNLEAIRLNNSVEQSTLYSQPFVSYVDAPHTGLTAGSNSMFLLLVLLFVALLTPTFVFYIRIVQGKRVLIPEEVSRLIPAALLGKLPRTKKGKKAQSKSNQKAFDLLAIRVENILNTDLSAVDQTKTPEIVVVTSTEGNTGVSYTTEHLAHTLSARGRKTLVLRAENGLCKAIADAPEGVVGVSVSILDPVAMQQVIDQAKANGYSYILIDCAALSQTNDAHELERYSALYLWVFEHLTSRIDKIEDASSLCAPTTTSAFVYNGV